MTPSFAACAFILLYSARERMVESKRLYLSISGASCFTNLPSLPNNGLKLIAEVLFSLLDLIVYFGRFISGNLLRRPYKSST